MGGIYLSIQHMICGYAYMHKGKCMVSLSIILQVILLKKSSVTNPVIQVLAKVSLRKPKGFSCLLDLILRPAFT